MQNLFSNCYGYVKNTDLSELNWYKFVFQHLCTIVSNCFKIHFRTHFYFVLCDTDHDQVSGFIIMDIGDRFMDQMKFAFIILPCFVLSNKAIGHTYCRVWISCELSRGQCETSFLLVYCILSASNFSHHTRAPSLKIAPCHVHDTCFILSVKRKIKELLCNVCLCAGHTCICQHFLDWEPCT